MRRDKAFDKYESRGAYHWKWYAANRYRYRDLVTRSVLLFPSTGTILDVGCGDGVGSYFLYKNGLRVHGIDTSTRAIELANEMVTRKEVHRGAWRCIPYSVLQSMPRFEKRKEQMKKDLRFTVQSLFDVDDSKYDYALMQEVVEHIEDARSAVAKLAHLVTQYAIITAPNGELTKKHELDYHHWGPKQFLDLFAGLEAELIHVDRSNLYAKVMGC